MIVLSLMRTVPFQNYVEEAVQEQTSLSDFNCCSEPVSYAAVEDDGTSGLVIEVFDDLDKVGADVVLLHSCPQSCMPNPVEGLFEVYVDMAEAGA